MTESVALTYVTQCSQNPGFAGLEIETKVLGKHSTHALDKLEWSLTG